MTKTTDEKKQFYCIHCRENRDGKKIKNTIFCGKPARETKCELCNTTMITVNPKQDEKWEKLKIKFFKDWKEVREIDEDISSQQVWNWIEHEISTLLSQSKEEWKNEIQNMALSKTQTKRLEKRGFKFFDLVAGYDQARADMVELLESDIKGE